MILLNLVNKGTVPETTKTEDGCDHYFWHKLSCHWESIIVSHSQWPMSINATKCSLCIVTLIDLPAVAKPPLLNLKNTSLYSTNCIELTPDFEKQKISAIQGNSTFTCAQLAPSQRFRNGGGFNEATRRSLAVSRHNCGMAKSRNFESAKSEIIFSNGTMIDNVDSPIHTVSWRSTDAEFIYTCYW